MLPIKNDLIGLLLAAVVIAGAIGILYVVMKVAGIVVPAFVITIFWIVLVVVIAVLAIKYIASLIGR
jgi:hypothetical protein